MMAASVVGKGIAGKHIESCPAVSPSPHSTSLHEPLIANSSKLDIYFTISASKSNVIPSKDGTCDDDSSEGVFEANDQLSSLSPAGKQLALSSPLGLEASPVPSIVNEEETNIALSQLKELDLAISARKVTKIDGRKTRWIEYRKKKQANKSFNLDVKKGRWLDFSKHRPACSSVNSNIKKELISSKLLKFKSKKKSLGKKIADIDLSVDINENSPVKCSIAENELLMEDLSKEDAVKSEPEEKELTVINNNNNNNIDNNNKINSSDITEPVASGSIMKVEATGDTSNVSGTTNVLETMKQHFLQGTVNVPDIINNGVKEKSVASKKQQNLTNGSHVGGNEILKRKRGRPKKDKTANDTIETKEESTNLEIKHESTNNSTNTIENKSSVSTSPNGNISLTPIANGNNSDQNIKFDFPGYSQSTTDFYARKNYLTKGLREVRKSESGSESGASSPEKNCSTPLPVSPISHSPPNWAGDVNISVPSKCPLISAAAKMLSAGNKKLGTTYGLAAKKKKILKKLSKKENIHKKENICTDVKSNGNSNNHNAGINKKNTPLKGLIGKSINDGKAHLVQIKRGRGRPKTKVDSPGLKWTKKVSTVIADVHNTMNGEPQTVISANNSLIQKKKKAQLLKKASENELGQYCTIIDDEIVSCIKDKSESSNLNNSGNFINESIVPDSQLASSSTSPLHSNSQMVQNVAISQSASKFNQSLLESTKQKNEYSSLVKEEKFVQNENTFNSSVGEKLLVSSKFKDRPKTLAISTMPSSNLSINSEYKPYVPEKISDHSNVRVPIAKKMASTIIVSTAEALKQQNPPDKKQRILINEAGSSKIGLQSVSINGTQRHYTNADNKKVEYLPETATENKLTEKSTKQSALVQEVLLGKKGELSKLASPLNNSTGNTSTLEQSSVKSVVSPVSEVSIINKEKHVHVQHTSMTKSISDRLPTSTVVTMSNKVNLVKKPLHAVPINRGTSISISSQTSLTSVPKSLINKSPKKPPEKLKNKSLDAVIEKLHSPNSKRVNSAKSSMPLAQISNNSPSVSALNNNLSKSFDNKDTKCSISVPKKVNELPVTNIQNSSSSANEKKIDVNLTSNEKKVVPKPLEKKIIKQNVSNLPTEKKIVNQEVVNKLVKLNRLNSINNLPAEKKVSQNNVSVNRIITESSAISGVEKKAPTVYKLKLVANDKQIQLKGFPDASVIKENGGKVSLDSPVINGQKEGANEGNVTNNQGKVFNGITEKLAESEISPIVKPDEKIPRYLKQLFQDEGVQNMLRSVNEEATSSIDGSPSIDGSSHKLRPKRVNENFNSESQEMDEAYYLSNSKRKRRGTEVDNLYSDEGALNMLTSLDGERKKVQMNDDASSDTSQESSLKSTKVRKAVSDISSSEFTRKRRLSGSSSANNASQSHEPKKHKLEDKSDSGIDISPSSASSENQRISSISQSALLEKRKPGRPSLPVALKKKTKLQLQFQLKKQLQRIGIASENLSIPQMKEILNKVRVKETYTTNKPVTVVPPLKIKLPAQMIEKQVRITTSADESSPINIKQIHVENDGAHKPPNRIFKTLVSSHQGSSDGNRSSVKQSIDRASIHNTSVKRISNSYNQAPLQSLLRPLDPSLGQKNKVRSTQEGIRHSQRASVRHAEGGHYRDITLRRFNNFMHVILTPSTTKMKNALNSRVLRELCDALTMLRRDDSVRMVLFTSTGSTFCQGIDLTSLQHPNQDTRKKNAENLARGIKDFLRALAQFPKMIVAGVNGNAMGLGVTILPLFDIVYASDKAEFFLPYSKLGQVPEGGATYTFPYYYGKLQANKMFFGQKVTATQAQQMGLISEAIWHETFLQDIIPKVALLATQSPQSMEGTKALVNHHIVTKLELSVESECRLLLQHWMSNQFMGLCKKFLDIADIQLQKPVNLPL